MKKIILLAGYPATVKTYISNVIKKEYPKAMYIAQDEFKELLYDKVGFNNLEQKDKLVEYSREIFYKVVTMSLEQNEVLLLDYPFSYKQIDFLNDLKEKFEVNIMTIRLIADLDILYDRRVERDILDDRNKGHILNKYHGYETYTRQTYPLLREEYKENCIKGKYDKFEYGKLLEVDVSYYDKIDYPHILKSVNQFIKE